MPAGRVGDTPPPEDMSPTHEVPGWVRVSAGGPAALLLDAVLAVAPIVTSRQIETYSASAPVQVPDAVPGADATR